MAGYGVPDATVEACVTHARALKVERSMQPLTVLDGQPCARLLDLLVVLDCYAAFAFARLPIRLPTRLLGRFRSRAIFLGTLLCLGPLTFDVALPFGVALLLDVPLLLLCAGAFLLRTSLFHATLLLGVPLLLLCAGAFLLRTSLFQATLLLTLRCPSLLLALRCPWLLAALLRLGAALLRPARTFGARAAFRRSPGRRAGRGTVRSANRWTGTRGMLLAAGSVRAFSFVLRTLTLC
jgi:hypothetical protein